jgi:alkaline phosphatase D
MSYRLLLNRRAFLSGTALSGGGLLAARLLPASLLIGAPAIAKSMRPQLPYGVASGDVTSDRAVIWSRSDRPARMIVEYATTASFKNPKRVIGPAALDVTDYTARIDLSGLPAGQSIFYRVMFQDLADVRRLSEPVSGHFRTAPAGLRDIAFQWSGDTAGQGWGINEDWGGMRIYQTMRQARPDFFIHCGDCIYADGPLAAEQPLPDGGVWKNRVTEEKSKVAETLKEFRGNYAYNLMDQHLRAFNAEVPIIAQWDDHETTNNWYPDEVLASDERYTEKSAALLAARARRAFLEYMPVRYDPLDPERIYRAVHYGPLLDVFVIDMRSYRGPNSGNRQERQSRETEFLGSEQIRWLKRQLLGSTATWKVIASDMPIGLVVLDGETAFENLANGDSPALGRELEMSELLRFIKHNRIANVVWLTADVHYTAAHYYDPDKARFSDFNPFWEFVSGPLNAGTFGPSQLDNTFGPQVMFQKAPADGQQNLPPSAGMQFYGEAKIAAATQVLTVYLKDLTGSTLYSVELEPELA